MINGIRCKKDRLIYCFPGSNTKCNQDVSGCYIYLSMFKYFGVISMSIFQLMPIFCCKVEYLKRIVELLFS